jgi:predicted P-loop ATPase
MNPGGSGYLGDETGAHRFWPIECAVGWLAGRKVDVDALREAKDHLWAEARIRFERGERWWLDTLELEADQEKETDARYDHDAWTSKVMEFVGGEVSVIKDDILATALRLSEKDWSRATQIRVGTIMRKAGWKYKRDGAATENSSRVRRYYNPVVPAPKDNVVVPLHPTRGEILKDLFTAEPPRELEPAERDE